MAAPSAPIESSAAGPTGGFARVIGVLINPGPTFESIAAKPTWIIPILLSCVMAIVILMLFGSRVGWRSFMERKLANNQQFEQMSPHDREAAMDRAVKIGTISAYVIGPIAPILYALVAAAVLLAAFNLLASARIGFITSLSIVSYGWVPFLLSGVLGIVLLLVKDPSTIDLEHLVASNAGAFMSNDSPKWLLALATSLDLFVFWVLALLAIGYHKASPKKVSLGKSLAIVIGVWVIWVLLRVGSAGAFGGG